MKLVMYALLFTALINAAADEHTPSEVSIQDPVLVCLKPPRLMPEHLGTRVLCHRPVRTGGPYINIERRGASTIVHNYGHGGDGWTVAPGCVRHLIRQFNDNVQVAKEEPIVVIGAGAMGLFTAYMLKKGGHTNIIVLAEQFENLTSHNAGGFCAPTNTQELDPAKKELMDACGIESYQFYAAIAQGEQPDFDPWGARFMDAFLMPGEQRFAAWEDAVMKTPIPVTVDFENGKSYQMKAYRDAIFMDTHRLMASLMKCLQNNVHFKRERVASFDEIANPYIFNCAGLGAKDLKASDDDAPMSSGQGHLIMLQNQNPNDIDYIIGYKGGSSVTSSGQIVHDSVYMFPKQALRAPETSVGVLGGTYIEDADATTPNEEQFDRLVERARYFFGN